MKVDILLLFNVTDYAAQPWLDRGYSVLAVDTQHPKGLTGHPQYLKLGASVSKELLGALKPRLVIGFPPCTDLAVSGAAHFASKRLKNPKFQDDAAALCRLAYDHYAPKGVPVILENPVSVLASLWRKPNFYFNPCDYGQYIPIAEAEHPEFPDHIAPRDAYTKKTGIWCTPDVVKPPVAPVEPESQYSRQHKKLGGKGAKTKKIRSTTPRGFMEALCRANEHIIT